MAAFYGASAIGILVGLVVMLAGGFIAGLLIMAASIAAMVMKYNFDTEMVSVKCDWCGGYFAMMRAEYLLRLRNQAGAYCSGRCERADESSRGVKEKRYRIIDHE